MDGCYGKLLDFFAQTTAAAGLNIETSREVIEEKDAKVLCMMYFAYFEKMLTCLAGTVIQSV